MLMLFLGLVSLALSVGRFYVPTSAGLSVVETFKAVAHIFVGAMIAILIQCDGQWLFGWVALLLPSFVELWLFITRKVRGGA